MIGSSSVMRFDATEVGLGDIDAKTAASLLAVAGDIALVMDSAGVIHEVSLGSSESQFGAATQWVGRPWSDTVTADTRAKIDTLVKEALASGTSKRRQVNHALPDAELDAAVDAIFDGLEWLGLAGDEPPVFQFARSARHAEVAAKSLLVGGNRQGARGAGVEHQGG